MKFQVIIIYHLLRVECNMFANWIYLKIFSRAQFQKKYFHKNQKNITFILIHFLHYGFQITYNMTRKMHDGDDEIVFFWKDVVEDSSDHAVCFQTSNLMKI